MRTDQLLAVETRDLGQPVVDVGELFGFVKRVDTIRDRIENLFVAFELGSALFSLGDVFEIHRQPAFGRIRRHLEMRVQRLVWGFERDCRLRFKRLRVLLVEHTAFGFGKLLEEVAADECVFLDSKDDFGSVVEIRHCPVGIDRKDGVDDAFEHGL